MNRLMTLVICFVAILASLGLTAEVRGETDFYHSSSLWVDNDFQGGGVNAYGVGVNAVTTQIQTSMSYNLNLEEGTASIHSYTSISGIFGDPTAENPYYDFMGENGLHSSATFGDSEVIWNGEWYEFNTIMSVWTQTTAMLIRNDEHTAMSGYFQNNSNGQGVIPINSYTSLQLFEGGAGLPPGWQLQIDATFLYTGGFTLVPAPGAFALLGLGGISFRLRRRS